jgi:hypothetical protein
VYLGELIDLAKKRKNSAFLCGWLYIAVFALLAITISFLTIFVALEIILLSFNSVWYTCKEYVRLIAIDVALLLFMDIFEMFINFPIRFSEYKILARQAEDEDLLRLQTSMFNAYHNPLLYLYFSIKNPSFPKQVAKMSALKKELRKMLRQEKIEEELEKQKQKKAKKENKD